MSPSQIKKPRDEWKGKEVREEILDAWKHGRKRKVSFGVQLVPYPINPGLLFFLFFI